jgi:hypothetical protein
MKKSTPKKRLKAAEDQSYSSVGLSANWEFLSSVGITAFLAPQDIAACIGSKEQHRLFQPVLNEFKLLHFIVRGEQENANALLTSHPELLLHRGTITDYSNRIFKNISAYECAYWSKDTHMCRMLESHMDAETATIIHKRCLEIDETGLTYEHRDVVIEGSRHFDFAPLISALQDYADERIHSNTTGMKAAWRAVGIAQQDVPAHVANEYCRRDRSFQPLPTFHEKSLPRTLNVMRGLTPAIWFPDPYAKLDPYGRPYAKLDPSDEDVTPILRSVEEETPFPWEHSLCSVIRHARTMREGRKQDVGGVPIDLTAVQRLNKVRTLDLTQSLENLALISQEPVLGSGTM